MPVDSDEPANAHVGFTSRDSCRKPSIPDQSSTRLLGGTRNVFPPSRTY